MSKAENNIPVYSLEQAKAHKKDGWLIIDGEVYDLTPFLDDHPGGRDYIIDNAGTDVSYLFKSDKVLLLRNRYDESFSHIVSSYRFMRTATEHGKCLRSITSDTWRVGKERCAACRVVRHKTITSLWTYPSLRCLR